jgi:putative membrane protein
MKLFATNSRPLASLALLASCLALSSQASFAAPAAPSNPPAPQQELFSADALTVAATKLHKINKDEIDMAPWAGQKAQSQEVKDFIQMISSDHQKLDQQLATLGQAQAFNISEYQPSNALESEAQRIQIDEIKKLQALNDASFDQAFVKFQIKAHKKALYEVELLQATLGNQSVLSDVLKASKAGIVKHLKEARMLDRRVQRRILGDSAHY